MLARMSETPPPSPAVDLLALRALLDRIDEFVAHPAFATPAPSVSGWTAEHHVAHLTLANELIVRNLKNLARGEGMLVQRGARPSPEASRILLAGVLPRGRAQSPRMVRPPEVVERELLLVWLFDVKRGFGELDPSGLRDDDVSVPHQLLGPLNGAYWLRFALVHTRHHLVIAREVLVAAADRVAVPEI